MLLAIATPAVVKPPPATTSPSGSVSRARTVGVPPPDIPVPSVYQFAPFHPAMEFAGTPPTLVNSPPATRSPSGRAVRAWTTPAPFMPKPRADHAAPFH